MVGRAVNWSWAVFALLLFAHADARAEPAEEQERLERARTYLQDESTAKQQKGLAMLGRLKTPGAVALLREQFERLETGALPLTLWLDLFEAAERTGDADLQTRLEARRKRALASPDPLLRFRECLEGGDAEEGRELFFEAPQTGCVRCHSVQGRGGKIGPELGGLGQRTERIYLLESIVEPDAAVVLGYSHIFLTLKSGETASGLLNSENRDTLTLISIVDGSRRQIASDSIASRLALPTAMPPGFGQALTKRELRDLVEFLATTPP